MTFSASAGRAWDGLRLPWLRPRRGCRHVAHLEGVLGTSLELQVAASTRQAGPRAERLALAEIDRLEAIFNIYRAQSEVSLWQGTRGEDVAISPELLQVLEASEMWTRRTGGAFQPAAEAFTRLWKERSEQGEAPRADEMEALAHEMAGALWRTDPERLTAARLTRLPIALNSVAKGFIIDRAALCAAGAEGVEAVLVNIGGDLRHVGRGGVPVAIANPFEDAENSEPIAVVQVANRGLATSGGYRRGFRVGERWMSHVLDPRTGRPVEHTVSASVVAGDAMSADVLATACSVLAPDESLRLADSLPGVGVLIIEDNGARVSNALWDSLRI